jgi:hypothetical protein
MVLGCAENLPSSNTELGRIARIGSVNEFQAALKAFGDARKHDKPRLRRELLAAGFVRDREVSKECEYFRWAGRRWGGMFEKGMILGICPDGIHVGGGYLAL